MYHTLTQSVIWLHILDWLSLMSNCISKTISFWCLTAHQKTISVWSLTAYQILSQSDVWLHIKDYVSLLTDCIIWTNSVCYLTAHYGLTQSVIRPHTIDQLSLLADCILWTNLVRSWKREKKIKNQPSRETENPKVWLFLLITFSKSALVGLNKCHAR